MKTRNEKGFPAVLLAICMMGTLLFSAMTSNAQKAHVKNVALVHGAFADGSGYRGLYDILTKKGYKAPKG